MKIKDLPDRWLKCLERYTDEKYGSAYKHRGKLGASDFLNTDVGIRFPDGSSAHFRHALIIAEPEWNEIAVFTEHCGHHIFSSVDLQVTQKVVDSK